MSQHFKACCSTAPAIAKDYILKGSYSQVSGTNTYITGPTDATKCILMVFDIFGFAPQTLQGADILAYSNKTCPYLVIVPDFFDRTPADPSWFAPNASKADKAKIVAFFQNRAAPPLTLARFPGIVKEITDDRGIKEWGAFGLCWGGKPVSISSAAEGGMGWKAAAQVHPSMLDPLDANAIKIPFAMLPSGDEDKEEVEKFGTNLTGEKVLETFGDMPHGWMGARADLENERVRSEYERGYKIIAEFFKKYL